MKLAIFAVFFFCAAAVSAQEFEELYDFDLDQYSLDQLEIVPRALVAKNIKQAADRFVQKSITDFHKVQEKFKHIAEKIKEGAEKTKDKVTESVSAVEDKFKELLKKGKNFFTCIKQNFPGFKDLKDTAEVNIKACVKSVYEAVRDLESTASGHSTELVKTLASLAEIVGECVSNNAVAAAKCAFTHIEQTKKLVETIIEDFEFLVKVAREKAPPLINDVKVCKETNFAAIVKKVEEVSESVRECTKIQEN